MKVNNVQRRQFDANEINTVSWACKRDCRCWCKSWRIDTPSSSVSSIVLLLSLILSPDWFSLSVVIINLDLWSAEAYSSCPNHNSQNIYSTLRTRKRLRIALQILREVATKLHEMFAHNRLFIYSSKYTPRLLLSFDAAPKYRLLLLLLL
jgi:hypothetical protein